MRRIFDLAFANRRERNKVKMAETIDKYKQREGDNSSAEVQGMECSLAAWPITVHCNL